MQGMTKRVNNMEDPSPETKANVSGCESLHKQEKTVAQKKMHAGYEHGVGKSCLL